MPSSHLILCRPLLLLPLIPPSIRVFSNESTLRMRWPKYWSFSFSISPSNEHPGLVSFRMEWLDLLTVQGTLKGLGTPTPQFKSINSLAFSFLHSPTLASIHDHCKNHSPYHSTNPSQNCFAFDYCLLAIMKLKIPVHIFSINHSLPLVVIYASFTVVLLFYLFLFVLCVLLFSPLYLANYLSTHLYFNSFFKFLCLLNS